MHLHPRNPRRRIAASRYRLANTTASGGWHTLRLDWSPGRLRFFADGAEIWRVTGNQVPDEPMYLVFNLAVGGVYPGPPDDSTPLPRDVRRRLRARIGGPLSQFGRLRVAQRRLGHRRVSVGDRSWHSASLKAALAHPSPRSDAAQLVRVDLGTA